MADELPGAAAPIPSADPAASPQFDNTSADTTPEMGQREMCAGLRRGIAAVVRLPHADSPIVQQSPPRGRRPKHVLSLWRARMDRPQAINVLALEAQLALVLQAKYECYQRSKVLSLNLKEADRLDRLNVDEYGLLDRQSESIKEQLALAAKAGAA